MTLTLEIGTELERILEARACRRGLALAAYILDLAQRDAAADRDSEAAADDLWAQLTNDATHNAAVIVLAQAPEAVRAIVMQRSAEVAGPYYASAAGKRESKNLEDWQLLDGEPFQVDGAEGSTAR